MRSSICIGLFIATACTLSGQPLSPRVANYTMDVTLDIRQKRLHASTELIWINPSADTVDELQFHIYYNAFKNSRSTWMQEGEHFMAFVGPSWYENCHWGWTVIDQMEDSRENDLTAGMQFIQPDNNNIYDETVLRVSLLTPVLPNDSAVLHFSWTAQIAKAMIRTGYNKDFYFFAQWFPKLGVYEPAGMRYAMEGGWNCHQYHADGEYYADFGVYDVNLTVPNDFVVAASGILIDKAPHGDMTTWSFRAEDVIDFTWTASPHFISIEDQWQDVGISVMMYPDHERFAPAYIESIRNVFTFMDAHVGDYPYPKLTVIDPPIHGMFVGGMEYPMLTTSLSCAIFPKGFRSIETLVVHEFVHQYFMQMVASNEQEEPWMDEGITSYYEGRIMDHFYGPKTSMLDWLGIRVGNFEYTRHEFFASGKAAIAPNTNRSWEYPYQSYSMTSYNKAALWLKTLEGLVGVEVMDEIMKTYFERWKFRHPCGRDFTAVVNDITAERMPEQWPEGMDWYFNQVLEGTGLCDYAVASISNDEVRDAMGFVNDTALCVIPEHEGGDKAPFRNRVIVQRLGEIRVPVDIVIAFDNGRVVTEWWDGQDKVVVFEYSGNAKVVSAEVDPERKIFLDYNFINNSMSVRRTDSGARYYFSKYIASVQHFLESLSLLM